MQIGFNAPTAGPMSATDQMVRLVVEAEAMVAAAVATTSAGLLVAEAVLCIVERVVERIVAGRAGEDGQSRSRGW